jgi:hypothetical protein
MRMELFQVLCGLDRRRLGVAKERGLPSTLISNCALCGLSIIASQRESRGVTPLDPFDLLGKRKPFLPQSLPSVFNQRIGRQPRLPLRLEPFPPIFICRHSGDSGPEAKRRRVCVVPSCPCRSMLRWPVAHYLEGACLERVEMVARAPFGQRPRENRPPFARNLCRGCRAVPGQLDDTFDEAAPAAPCRDAHERFQVKLCHRTWDGKQARASI